ncbi:MAG: glycoside hydrolase family 78 protein [Tannerellaceae bacterium]|nr:glycoside hydrolase family 78 protein [Tannerellaceae bacterium]
MKKLFLTSIVLLLALSACSDRVSINVGYLRCEGLETPLGIDSPPHLSWIVTSSERGVVQTGYRIIVSSSAALLQAGEGDLWDTGDVQSDASVNIPYGGKFAGRTTYYWKVRTSTNKGQSRWSAASFWTSGLPVETDWKARWIGLEKGFPGDVLTGKTRLSARYLRRDFVVEDKPVESAMLYISGLGLYEVSINGEKLGWQLMSPTPTDYTKVVKYNVFDVSNNISGDANTIGVTLGNGRYFSMRRGPGDYGIPEIRHFGYPCLIAQLEIRYADGSEQTVVSDAGWKITANGPIRANSEFDGEEYDARLEMPGWDVPGYDDGGWEMAELVPPPGGRLEGQVNRNMTSMETLLPVSITEYRPNVYIMDMGQNMVGRIAMTVSGERGRQVTLRFAESLNADGSLYMDNIRGALVTDRYTLKGDEVEEWEPSFTYHGFRYVEITNYPGEPQVNAFTGNVIYDEMEMTGEFETSSSLINRIYSNACWGIRGNYRGMPTDCPQRDERMGWLGDRATGSHGESYIFNNYNLYAKWLDDIEQSQRPNGSLPDVAPNYWSMYSDNMTWPGAYVIIANMLYEQYGSVAPIIAHYPSMKKWLEYMRDRYMVDGILTKDTYGDWCMPPERPELIHSQDPARKTEGALLSTAFYYRILTLMERFARLQDKAGDAEAFAVEAAMVKTAFNARYLNADGTYSNNTVTANLLPLCFGMVPPDSQSTVFNSIASKTATEFDNHVSTGLIGIQWLMRGLTMYGRPDMAYRIVTNRSYPSWGYMIERGATTIWELWNGDTADPSMNSGNHVMLLGDLVIWFYEHLAGIRNHPGSSGFNRIEMKPCIMPELDYVKASYNSVHGLICSHWLKTSGGLRWDINIPCNTTATVHIPAAGRESICMSDGSPLPVEARFIEEKDGYVIYEIGSGQYDLMINTR